MTQPRGAQALPHLARQTQGDEAAALAAQRTIGTHAELDVVVHIEQQVASHDTHFLGARECPGFRGHAPGGGGGQQPRRAVTLRLCQARQRHA